jgi:phosphoribosyl-ATP pyrophosphohydrolase
MGGIMMAQSYTANQAANKAAKQNEQYAEEAQARNLAALNDKKEETRDKYDMESMERMRQAARERASLQVAMAESGMMGNSSLMEIADTYLQDSYDQALIRQNEDNALKQIGREEDRVVAETKSAVNKARASKVSGLSMLFQAGAAGAKGAYQGYTAGQALEGLTMQDPEVEVESNSTRTTQNSSYKQKSGGYL